MFKNITNIRSAKAGLFLLFFFMMLALQAQNFVIHKAKAGETISDIAKQYRLAPSDILQYNADILLPGAKLKEGQHVLIPTFDTKQTKDSLVISGHVVDYKYHTVGENETLFSLSKMYNSKIESIVKINKVEGFNIKLGQILIIPIMSDPNAIQQIDTLKYTYYEVKPKQGKWRVSYDHGITIDELERLNPDVKDKELQIGQKLIVPRFLTMENNVKKEDVESYIYYEVLPHETMYSLSKRYNIDIDQMIALNPELKDGLKSGQTIRFPKYPLEKQGGVTTDKNDLIKEIDTTDKPVVSEIPPDTIVNMQPIQVNLLDSLRLDKTYRIAILLPFKLEDTASLNALDESSKCKLISKHKILDYYSGIKLAIDSLRTLGMNIQYDVFDTKASPFVVGKILEETDLSDYNFVIGPIKKDNIDKVAHYLELDNTPIVVHNYKGVNKYRNLIVTTSANDDLEQHMLQYIKEQSADKAVHVVYTPDMQQKADTIAKLLGGKITLIKAEETKKGYSIKAEELTDKMQSGKENIVVLITDDDAVTFSVLSTLNSLGSKKRVSLFTLDDKRYYEDNENDRMNTFLSHLNYHFPSKMIRLFDQQFVKTYKEKYGMLPSFVSVNGFDTTFDLLVRSGNADNLFEGLQKIGRTKQTSKVYLYRHTPESGFHNQASLVLRISPQLELEQVE